MNNELLKISDKALKIAMTKRFFVGKKVPFVWFNKSTFFPFVGINIPIGKIQRAPIRISGFTVAELVVTMAVALTLVALAAPTFRTLTQNSRMAAQVNDLVADINYARSEAIKRRANVSICTSSDGATCTGGNWRDGRIIRDGAGTVLRFRGPLDAPADTLTTNAPDPFSFDSRGAPPAAMRFTFCDVRGVSDGKILNINTIGQTILDRTTPPVATCL